jgi:hypothetical protein
MICKRAKTPERCTRPELDPLHTEPHSHLVNQTASGRGKAAHLAWAMQREGRPFQKPKCGHHI